MGLDEPPRYFSVVFFSAIDKDFEYEVVTHFGAYKAVVIATWHHASVRPDEPIGEVQVEDRGAVELDADRYPKIIGEPLLDRYEW